MQTVHQETKTCPFCSETIRVEAVKCRYCAEFLNTRKAKALSAQQDDEYYEEEELEDEEMLYGSSPSLWGMAPTVLKTSVVIALGVLIIKYPLENMLGSLPRVSFTYQQAQTFARYRELFANGIIILSIAIMLLRALILKATFYFVTGERIEWSRGIFDRRIDNIDMFRVVDLKLRRNIFDCIVGIGSVTIITTDKSDPEFTFKKVPHPRELYDIIKKASLKADKDSNVFHLE